MSLMQVTIDDTTLAQVYASFRGHELVDLDGLTDTLNALDDTTRVGWIRSLKPRAQAQLFEACADRSLSITGVVPSTAGVGREVIHEGHNTLPAFTMFQKRFSRPDANIPELAGFNYQTMAPFTGPGYFVAYDDDASGEVVIDYRRIPTAKADGWPKIIPNERRLGRFVYAGMVDRLRRVSDHVSIGRAFRDDKKAMDAWFVLCRVG